MVRCGTCNGGGLIYPPQPDGGTRPTTCPSCHGVGTVGGSGPSISSFGKGSGKSDGGGGWPCLTLVGLYAALGLALVWIVIA